MESWLNFISPFFLSIVSKFVFRTVYRIYSVDKRTLPPATPHQKPQCSECGAAEEEAR